MKEIDVLIIGSSAAGLNTAITGKNNFPEKDFLVVHKEEKLMVPCGIPYIFGSLDSSDQNVMPAGTKYQNLGIKEQVGEVQSIDRENKISTLTSGEQIKYGKLVLATGSTPKIPKWLNGADLKNAFVLPKDKDYLDQMKEQLKNLEKIVIIGGGFIGVEVSDELNKAGKDVTVVEILSHILTMAFDTELAEKAQEILKSRGVKVKTGQGVSEIVGKNGTVTGVKLENGETLEADGAIISMGYEPNSGLAREAGLELGENNYIWVDEYMRTTDPDIIAVGDCAEKRNFITRKPADIMLASTACAEGRIAGMNLFKLSAVKTFSGTIAIYSTALNGHAFGTAGLTENVARQEGFDVVTGTFEGIDKHPGTLPNTNKQIVKLIIAKESGIIIGGEVIGGVSAGELTNLIGFIIQNKTTVHTLLTSQIGTQPLLTGSPAAYPLLKAAEIAALEIKAS